MNGSGMTDEDFVAEAVRLDKLGAEGDPALKEHLRGQRSRLIALAARGVAKRASAAAKTAQARTRIPTAFPGPAELEAAVAFWNENRRPDLVARKEQIAGEFNAHHRAHGKLMADWPAAWRNWYSRELNMKVHAAAGSLFSAPVVFEQTTLAGWAQRIRVFLGLDPECPEGKDQWPPRWGAPWGHKDCRAPQEAYELATRGGRRAAR